MDSRRGKFVTESFKKVLFRGNPNGGGSLGQEPPSCSFKATIHPPVPRESHKGLEGGGERTSATWIRGISCRREETRRSSERCCDKRRGREETESLTLRAIEAALKRTLLKEHRVEKGVGDGRFSQRVRRESVNSGAEASQRGIEGRLPFSDESS